MNYTVQYDSRKSKHLIYLENSNTFILTIWQIDQLIKFTIFNISIIRKKKN